MSSRPPRPFRVRTITFGTNIRDLSRPEGIEAAIAGLRRARLLFTDAGYEVQTLRIALPPIIAGLDAKARDAALAHLEDIDSLLTSSEVILALGPLLFSDRGDPDLAPWTVELVRRTRAISFSTVVASQELGVHRHAASCAAHIMSALSTALPGGLANFRFAAAANIPPGTPFFPVAWHRGDDAVALGLESAPLVDAAWTDSPMESAERRLRDTLERALLPVEKIGEQIAENEQRTWLGIDVSPAPLADRSIAAGIERLTGLPFGSASTLNACAMLTGALKSLHVKTCGYSGLMLPVLEDPLLAKRASEGRFGIRELLLYSSVCGTGLDVVPIAGDTPVPMIAGLITDVAALSTRLRKPLSARLLLVPGKKAGELATFADPVLNDAVVMKLD